MLLAALQWSNSMFWLKSRDASKTIFNLVFAPTHSPFFCEDQTWTLALGEPICEILCVLKSLVFFRTNTTHVLHVFPVFELRGRHERGRGTLQVFLLPIIFRNIAALSNSTKDQIKNIDSPKQTLRMFFSHELVVFPIEMNRSDFSYSRRRIDFGRDKHSDDRTIIFFFFDGPCGFFYFLFFWFFNKKFVIFRGF